MMQISKPVYRFAPSPTGFLHVGGARTAIFNWLLARHSGGKFHVRLEDTDRKRSTADSIEQILASLSWLGLDWDDDLIFQSHRVERHKEVAALLLDKNKAYRCFCSKEELQQKREKAESAKASYLYDGTCRNLSPEQIRDSLEVGKPFTIRIRIPEGETVFRDGVHGLMRTQNSDIDDYVILRADQTPVYHLAVVVDDFDLGVTDVVRGDDHLSNTPKQVALYEALNWQVPRHAHLPLILGPDRNRLSKRHGASSVEEFREQGIMADALFNYLCLLGWSTGNDQELLGREELIKTFTLGRVNKANAVFDHQKLLWMNGQYLNNTAAHTLLANLSGSIRTRVSNYDKMTKNALYELIDLVKQRARTLTELEDGLGFFFDRPQTYDPSSMAKLFTADALDLLIAFRNTILENQIFSTDNLEKLLRDLAEKRGVKASVIIHPLRLAITGRTSSPGIFEIMHILGRNEVLERLNRSINFIRESVLETDG